MKKHIFVELDTGDQLYFDTPYEAFHFAKKQENVRRNSVECLVIGIFYGEDDGTVYKGQSLRIMLRALDNAKGWLRAVAEALNDREDIEAD